jgi:hypothetical protein
MSEVKKIFELTGATERFATIEKYSKLKADEFNMEISDKMPNEYVHSVFTANSILE